MSQLVKTIIDEMMYIQKSNKNGIEKKDYVLDKVLMSIDFDPLLEEVIKEFIDYIVIFDKGELKLNPKCRKIKKYICCL